MNRRIAQKGKRKMVNIHKKYFLTEKLLIVSTKGVLIKSLYKTDLKVISAGAWKGEKRRWQQ